MEAQLTEFLEEAKEKSSSTPLTLSVRELLARWSAKRRGYWIVERVRTDLDSFELTTEPDFNDVWIDADIKIVPIQQDAEQNEPTTTQETSTTSPIPREIYLRVNSLASANSGLVGLAPQDTVPTAQALMMRYDYSQLPVLSGERDLRGAVSWESIAQARIRNSECSLADATGSFSCRPWTNELLESSPRRI
jgi:hypothetical protein